MRQIELFIGALVILILFLAPAGVLGDMGFDLLGSLLGWIGVGFFILSMVVIALQPFLKPSEEDRLY
ncbi:hypothetical protein [Hydrogenivirga sp.]